MYGVYTSLDHPTYVSHSGRHGQLLKPTDTIVQDQQQQRHVPEHSMLPTIRSCRVAVLEQDVAVMHVVHVAWVSVIRSHPTITR